MTWFGIDLGSSFIKGALLDVENRAIGPEVRRPFPKRRDDLPVHWHEIDPSSVVNLTLEIIDELLSLIPSKASAGIVFCSQMGGLILVDPVTNKPLTNYLSWRDLRTTEFNQAHGDSTYNLVRKQLEPQTLQSLGNEVKPGSAFCLMAWLANRGLLPQNACVMSLADYVVAQMAQRPPFCQPTLALGMLDLAKRDWSQAAFTQLGLGDFHLNLPPLREFWEPVGTLDRHGHTITLYPSIGDHQCALLGADLQDDELSINISTGSQTSMLSPKMDCGEFQVRPYADHRFLKTITHLPAGRSLETLVELLIALPRSLGLSINESQAWNHFLDAAETAPETNLDVHLAFFDGPMGQRGHIQNITLDNLHIGALARAAIQNMANNYQVCADQLDPNRSWTRIAFSGGLARRSALLRQLVADRLQKPWRLSSVADETLQGLLNMAIQIGKDVTM